MNVILPQQQYEFMDNNTVHLYHLTLTQRFFILFENSRSCWTSQIISIVMMIVIAVSCVSYVSSSVPTLLHQPSTCQNPQCNNDPNICPGYQVCMPLPTSWMSYVEIICVSVFTVEYGCRILTVWAVPPRLAGLVIAKKRDKITVSMANNGSLGFYEFVETKVKQYIKSRDNRNTGLSSSTFIAIDSDNHETELDDCLDAKSSKPIIVNNSITDGKTGMSYASPVQSFIMRINTSFSMDDDDIDELHNKFFKTFRYACKLLNIVDLLAILPFYVQLGTSSGSSLSFVRVLRLARVFRIFKLSKNAQSVSMLTKTITKSVQSLVLVCFLVAIGVTFFGSVLYFIESGTYMVTAEYPMGAYYRQAGRHSAWTISPFRSIVVSMYWAVVTSSTIGYGEIVPITPWGQLVAVCCMYFGVLLLALPITVIGNNFRQEFASVASVSKNESADLAFESLRSMVASIVHHNSSQAGNSCTTGAPAPAPATAHHELKSKTSCLIAVAACLQEHQREKFVQQLEVSEGCLGVDLLAAASSHSHSLLGSSNSSSNSEGDITPSSRPTVGTRNFESIWNNEKLERDRLLTAISALASTVQTLESLHS